MKLFQTLGGVVSFMNVFAGIIGGIWLILLGKWQLPVFGLIIALIITNFLFPILMLPSYGLSVLSIKLIESKKVIAFYVSQFFSWTLNLSWIFIFVALTFSVYLGNQGSNASLPFLLLAYSLVAGPLGELTIGETSDENPTRMIVFLADLGMIAMSVSIILGLSLLHGLFVFVPFAIAGVVWGMVGALFTKKLLIFGNH